MATSFEVLLPCGMPAASQAAEAALDEVDRLEQQLTIYRDDSEVSRLNRLAAVEPVRVEARLFDLLLLAARLQEETEGAFDITAGALIRAWGFYRRAGRTPSTDELTTARARVGMRHVTLDPSHRTVRYSRPSLEINLGSIGKGYSLDRAAEVLRQDWNVHAGLLHGGHSSLYAIGRQPGARAWAVGIRHPWDAERRLAVVQLKDRALGTSAATFQHFDHAGMKLGHILDPRSGRPAETLASASALAPTAAEADALATAFFILGVDKTRAYCDAHPEIGAILLRQGDSTPVVIGLAPDGIELPPLCKLQGYGERGGPAPAWVHCS